jgi:multidrug efflux pump subunit AcrA (membrane-fusion protein)
MRSPIDGIVVSVDHAVGEYADLSTVIATLAQIQPLKVKLYLPLTAYPLVQVGMSASVRPTGPGAVVLPAKVTTKDQQIDAESNLFQAQLELPNPDSTIPAGLRCAVTFDPPP